MKSSYIFNGLYRVILWCKFILDESYNPEIGNCQNKYTHASFVNVFTCVRMLILMIRVSYLVGSCALITFDIISVVIE